MRGPYDVNEPLPQELKTAVGPHGIALVRTWKDGTTDPGWGGDTFMPLYEQGRFADTPIVHGYLNERWNFAIVMRSLRLVCIDIDGKNGGLQQKNIGQLGMLPHTLAETSKSGDGYHLFYRISEDVWDPDKGFAQFHDRIGLEQGIDLRATGCVYHYPQQRWNNREIAELPDHLKDRLTQHIQGAAAQAATIIKRLTGGDPMDVAQMHDELKEDLRKPIPDGRRNNTLFAIGQQMKLAEVPNWETLIVNRALAVGLSQDEAGKLIRNIQKYSVAP